MQHILVVDDHPATVELVRAHLDGAGFSVSSARNGAEALLLAQAEQVDLLILDLGMPGPGGLDVLRALRAVPALQQLPVIILTGHTSAEERTEALVKGADLYLTKPCPREKLLAAVKQLLAPQ